MVLVKNISNFIDDISSIDWFCNLGKMPDFVDVGIKFVKNIKEAQILWKSDTFEEASSVAWESFRQEIIKDKQLLKIWEDSFIKCRKVLILSLKNSETTQKLTYDLDQDIEAFSSQLPFIGSVGETIANQKTNKYRFFSDQIKFFIQGNWVCGWEGKVFTDKYIYPRSTFIVY